MHRTVNDADWEMAETLEEALRCPGQQLRQGERITELASQGSDFGVLGNLIAEDMLTESGKYYSAELGGPYFYNWTQSRLGTVTVAAVGKGSAGRSSAEVDAAIQQGAGAAAAARRADRFPGTPSGCTPTCRAPARRWAGHRSGVRDWPWRTSTPVPTAPST
ncbi:hypothetical protein [Streptomyces sp. NPDC050548]|uniref:hypothetical protein n=1 Tax=Streptomyces sp. NPDC050548 TaxID=3365629 RepID=UPI0037B093AD